MLPHSDCSNCDAIYIKVPSSETRCVNIQLQLLHLLVAGLVGRGRMVIARKSPAALTTLLVRSQKRCLSLTSTLKQRMSLKLKPFSERHRQKAVTDGEHLMEGQGRWKNTKHYSVLGQRSIFESVECLPRSVTFNLPSDQTNGYGDYGERLHRWVQQISSTIALHIYPFHRPNSLEMGDRGGWGPGAPPGGWGGPPRTQVQQVPHKSHLSKNVV